METPLLLLCAVLAAPFYAGLILKVKAFFGGKKGPPLLIHYYTLLKLCRKGAVFSDTTSFVFRLGPVIGLASALFALAVFPLAGRPALVSFPGDVIVLFYFFGLSRFFTVSAALDTGSPFEGMGAAREVFFAIFAEATLFLTLLLFFLLSGDLRLASFLGEGAVPLLWQKAGPPLLLVVPALFILLLTENARVPVDDPATHLELTMIHEVMILDHGGPDLALIELGSSLKLMFFAGLIVRLIYPVQHAGIGLNAAAFFLGLILIYLLIGLTESVTARYRMPRVPKFVLTAFALVFLATVITLEYKG